MLQHFLTINHVVCFYRMLTFLKNLGKKYTEILCIHFAALWLKLFQDEILKENKKQRLGYDCSPQPFHPSEKDHLLVPSAPRSIPRHGWRVSVEGATYKAQKEGNVWLWSTRSPLCQINMVEAIKMPSCSPSHPSLFLYLLTPHPRLP